MTTIAWMTRRRRQARDTPWLRAYYWLFATGLAIAIGVPQILLFASWLFAGSGVADPAVGLALLLTIFAALLLIISWAGPIVVSPPDAHWLVLSPLSRRHLLTRNTLILLVLLIVAGAVLGSLGVALLGRPEELAVGVLLGLAVTLATGSAAVLMQQAETRFGWFRHTALLVSVTAGLLIALRPDLPGLYAAPVAGATSAAAAFLAWRVWTKLPGFPARVLLDASARMGLAVSASLTLEPALLTSIAELRYWRRRRLRSRPWPASGRLLMARSDLRMLSRRPGRLAVLSALTAMPTVICLAGGTVALGVLVLLFGGLAVATTAAAGARWDAQHPELPRMFATKGLATRAIAPAALACCWVAAAFALLSLAGFVPLWSFLYGFAAAPGLTAGALRMARRGPIDHALPIIDLGSGGIPTGPMLWLIAGADLTLLSNAPLLFALTPLSLASHAVLNVIVLGAYLRLAGR